ncbi:MAG: hypothetical protein PHT41_08395 [Candidatus Omnitrophica bacterium]|nr:hypothetical protein [Candidatus Omnitrophota bacterium]MDD5238291.1 hypothetical protein [Candidatus Omnitrophota bacterium]
MGKKVIGFVLAVFLITGVLVSVTGVVYGLVPQQDADEDEVWEQYINSLTIEQRLAKVKEYHQRWLKEHPNATPEESQAELDRLSRRFGLMDKEKKSVSSERFGDEPKRGGNANAAIEKERISVIEERTIERERRIEDRAARTEALSIDKRPSGSIGIERRANEDVSRPQINNRVQ